MENITGYANMKLTVASYLKGIPSQNTNIEKPLIITNFIEGVKKLGDIGHVVSDYNLINADVAVIQGFVHNNSKNSQHLQLRKAVFDTQHAQKKRSIIVDSNLFLYADKGNLNKFLRYSYDGVFPNTGEYCNSVPDPKRWNLIQSRLNIKLKPWKSLGTNILICCQRDGGWSMSGLDLIKWITKTIHQVRQHSQRKIIVRFHPGDKNILIHKKNLKNYKFPNVKISCNEDILTDFLNAYCVITFNSSPAVAAAIEGIPVIVLDPNRSQAAIVSQHYISEIENLKEFDRELWIQQMAQMHWTLDELKDGSAWTHLRKWALK